jgi:hypothetical protein
MVVLGPMPVPPPTTEKHPIPPDDEVKAVRERVRAAFGGEYDKLTPNSAGALAAKPYVWRR